MSRFNRRTGTVQLFQPRVVRSTTFDLGTTQSVDVGSAPQFTAVNIGHPSNTTVTQESPGHIKVETSTIWDSGNLPTATLLKTPDAPVLVSALGSAAVPGQRRMVSDATVATFALAAVGGGTLTVPVWSDGTNWLIG